jgi:fructokinase
VTETTGLRPIIFGEVLFDSFPDGASVLGGAPFNVAWHLRGFGQDPLLVSRVGNDPQGRAIRDAMLAWGMDTSGLQLDSAHPTGRVEITLEDGEPSYDIVPEQAYDHVDTALLPHTGNRYLLYHGSLALRGATSRQACEQLRGAATARFVDINLRAPWWQSRDVEALLHGASWLKLNQHELADLGHQDPRSAMAEWDVRSLILTRGGDGAEWYGPDGGQWAVTPDRSIVPVDAVGAGDAFASVLLLAQLLGWEPQQAMLRAQNFASRVLGARGALLREASAYAETREAWGI